MATPPTQDDASDFELAIDDDLLAAAVAAVEARFEQKSPPASDPEAEAAFAADLEVEFGDDPPEETRLAEPDAPADEDGVDIAVVLDHTGDDDTDRASTEPETTELTGVRAALSEAERRIIDLEDELLETAEALDDETQERRRATAIAVRLKERVQRSDQLVTNARNGRAAAEARIEELEAAIERMEEDQERLRDRRRREVDEARQHGLAPTLKELLPVLDHLEMAVAHATAEPEKLTEGVRMIVGQFNRALESRGVTRVVATAGTDFDPECHEALQRVETTDQAPGTVLNELRAGYLLNGRLLRAARVTVSATPHTDDEAPAGMSDGPPPPPAETDEPAPTDGDTPEVVDSAHADPGDTGAT